MFRAVIGVLRILTVLVPDRILDVFEAVAVENPMNVRRNRGSGQEYGQRGLS